MTTKTRYFLFGGVALLVFGLAGGLVAYYVGVPAIRALAREPAELLYVPEEASVVAYANVRDIMASELRQQIRQVVPGSGAAEFREQTGIDIERDVDYVVAYLSPADGPDTPDQGLLLAHGNFDQGRIETLIEGHGGTAQEYRGKRFILRRFDVPAPPPGLQSQIPQVGTAPEMAVGFLQPGLVAVGTGAALRRAIDLEGGGGVDITRNDELMGLVRDGEEANAWAVGKFDRLVGRARLPNDVASRLPPITNFAATGYVNGGLSGRVRVDASTEEAAQQLSDVIRGFVALAKMQAGTNPHVTALLQSFRLQADGTSVALSFALPTSVLQALLPQSPPQNPR